MYWEKSENEELEKMHGRLIKRKVFNFPFSREVELINEYRLKKGHTILTIIRSDRFPLLYELLESYHKGIRLVSREEKYRNLYLIYEQFEKEQNEELKAIRHSISHSRKKLTDKRTTEILRSLFGDEKIDLKKYKHAKIFRKKLIILRHESEILLIKEILKTLPPKPNFLGKYYMLQKNKKLNIKPLKSYIAR
jgi:hypothetical protein